MEATAINFLEIYLDIKDEFKKIIKEDEKLEKQLFYPDSIKSRKVLTSDYLKPLSHMRGAKPEAITTQFIIKIFNQIGISNEIIVPEVRLRIINGFKGKSVNKYPDLAIINNSFKKDINKSLLFEIEALNKDLTKKNDGEGIEQALEWFHQSIGLYREYNAIITNFNEWYFLKFNDKGEQIISSKSPEEILNIIRYVALGEEVSYLEDETGEAISKKFFDEFSKRLKMLIDSNNNKIKILGSYGKSLLEEKIYDNKKIDFYRTIFHRLLFIKILLDWKLLKIDPVEEILNHEEKRNYYNTLRDLFFKVLNNDKERVDVFNKFTDLPFLNGGLFRLTNLEKEYPSIALNSDAIIDIWRLLKGFNFTLGIESQPTEKSNNIDPNILGYIFEKSIGDFRKASGAYYTRSEIAYYISRNTLYRYLFNKVNERFPKYKINDLNQIFMYEDKIKFKLSDYIIDILKHIKICDPFVGSGAFLVSIGDIIVSIYKFIYENIRKWDLRYNETRQIKEDKRPFKDLYSMKTFIVQNNLYGLDINLSAIDICKLRLWLWITQPPSTLDFLNLILNPLPNIEYNIREGNSFIGFTEDIFKIDSIDKKTGEVIQFVSIREWADKTEYSLSQMLKERNLKIKKYYNEKKSDHRNYLKAEIKNLTIEYNKNFDKLLLYDFKKKSIVGNIKKIKPDEFYNQILKNIHSMAIKAKNKINFEISNISKEKILKDNKGQSIKGIIFRKNVIIIQNRVFEPYKQDKFNPQDPIKIYERIIEVININDIKELKIVYFITNEDLDEIKRFHWSMEFSDFFNKTGFDIIITNPPYGNILSPLEKKILSLKDKITEDIYINFLLKLSRKELPFKYAGVLCPKSYLLRQKYIEIRNFFLINNGVFEITDMGSKQFQGATNEVQIIFFNTYKNYSNTIEIRDFEKRNTLINYDKRAVSEDSLILDKIKVCKYEGCEYFDANSSFYFYTFKNKCPICNKPTIALNRIRIKIDAKIYIILDKIERIGDLNYLNTISFPKMIRGEEDKGLREVKRILEKDLNNSCYFIKARSDFHYYYYWRNKSFNIEKIDPKIMKGRNYEYYKKPKLLIKHNSIIPEAIYTEDNVCFTSSIYSLLSDDIEELKYLCAIINSAVIQFYCIYGINNQKDTTINLNQYMIRHLPIIHCEQELKQEVIRRVDNITNLLSQFNGNFTDESKQFSKEIDDLIFELYSISDKEKKVIISLLKSQVDFFKNIY